ncbi:MAG TPA: hypothetical protein VHV50_06445 [Actinomycetota bacterium]|jgi:hypothetical protein|nr:hypothetical protein [Actinomycetota bacterium]
MSRCPKRSLAPAAVLILMLAILPAGASASFRETERFVVVEKLVAEELLERTDPRS